MKKFDLGQTITILANLGVVAEIVLSVIELRQNNEQLATQSRFNSYDTRIELNAELARNAEMVELLEKVDSGNELTAIEARQVRLQAASIFRRWDY